MSPTYKYPRPSVTTDIAVFSVRPGQGLRLLLIRRKRAPFEKRWALPGGFIEMDETLRDAAVRELSEETGLNAPPLRFFGVYDEPGRDPRGRTISAAYFTLLPPDADDTARADDDADEAQWFPANALPPLAFDHDRVTADALGALRDAAQTTSLLFDTLGEPFDWEALTALADAVLGSSGSAEATRRRLADEGVVRSDEDGAWRLERSALDRFVARGNLFLRQ